MIPPLTQDARKFLRAQREALHVWEQKMVKQYQGWAPTLPFFSQVMPGSVYYSLVIITPAIIKLKATMKFPPLKTIRNPPASRRIAAIIS